MRRMMWRLLVELVIAGIGFGNSQATGRVNCPMCAKPLTPSRAAFVVVTANGPARPAGAQTHRLTLRCIHCALQTIRGWHPTTALVRVRCAETGRWVTFRLQDGTWSASPISARLVLAPEAQGECLERHLAFVSPKAARGFLRTHPSLRHFSPTTIEEVMKEKVEAQTRRAG